MPTAADPSRSPHVGGLTLTLALSMALACGQVLAGEFVESAVLVPDDAAPGDYFGGTVSLDGDRAAVGAAWDDDTGTNSGSVWMFERQEDSTWAQVAKLTAADGFENNWFGSSLSLDGDRVLIGAVKGINNGARSGCAYIFDRQDDGTWTQQAKLVAWDSAAADYFGYRVALDGDRALVAVTRDDSYIGSARVFERQEDGTWPETARLDLAGGQPTDFFGHSVALSGDVALVGAGGIDDFTGRGFVFVHANDDWTLQAELAAEDGAPGDSLGISASLDGSVAVLGAHEHDGAFADSGAAYVFGTDADGTWSQTGTLLPSVAGADDRFGHRVCVRGDRVLVGADEHDGYGNNAGIAFSFTRASDGSWSQSDILTASDAGPGDLFGRSVSLSGDRALIGAFSADTSSGANAGAAYVFDLESNQPGCPSDINGDGLTNIDDLLGILNDWGCTGTCWADVTDDGTVDVDDLLAIIESWGPCPEG